MFRLIILTKTLLEILLMIWKPTNLNSLFLPIHYNYGNFFDWEIKQYLEQKVAEGSYYIDMEYTNIINATIYVKAHSAINYKIKWYNNPK